MLAYPDAGFFPRGNLGSNIVRFGPLLTFLLGVLMALSFEGYLAMKHRKTASGPTYGLENPERVLDSDVVDGDGTLRGVQVDVGKSAENDTKVIVCMPNKANYRDVIKHAWIVPDIDPCDYNLAEDLVGMLRSGVLAAGLTMEAIKLLFFAIMRSRR